MATNHARTKAGLAIGAAAAVIWGSLYLSSNQSLASSSQAPADTTTSTSTTLVAPAQVNTTKPIAQQPAARRTRRS